MKAIQLDEYGGPENLRFRDVVDPVAGRGQVLVDIHAASVNPVDWKIQSGERRDRLPLTLPYIPGVDFSGVVRAVGEGVADFRPGDEVYAVTNQMQQGGYAQAIAIDAGLVARKPASLGHAEAAALALVGLTALVSLEDTVKLASGETILVHAGAGGVGGFAVQFARHVGATVYATASTRNHDYVRSLGAHHVIDYNSQDFTRIVPPCDVVYDTVGGEVHVRSIGILKPGGRLAYIAPPPAGFEPQRDDVTIVRPNVGRDRAHLDRLSGLVAAGAITAPEITRFPLAEAAAAQRLSMEGHVRGKIVLEVR
jgi:NADPH:quinone reductase-like Zn-dependent oxidoreductase